MLGRLVSYGEAVLEALLSTSAGTTVVRWICGHTLSGHRYRVTLMAAEDTFIFDPLAECSKCLKPMNAAAYAQMVTAYELMCAEDELDG